MNKIYLIRHARKKRSLHTEDTSLDNIGKNQAISTGKFLSKDKISVIFTSPSKRTQETAYYINKQLGLKVISSSYLIERKKDLRNTDKNCLKNQKDKFSLKDGRQLNKFIFSLISKEKYENILLVSHGGTIADFLKYTFEDDYLKNSYPKFLTKGKYYLPECSITIIKYFDQNFTLEKLGFAKHLS